LLYSSQLPRFGVTDQWHGSPSSLVREEDMHELNGLVIALQKFLKKEEDEDEEPGKSTALDSANAASTRTCVHTPRS
jgi:hypothetical protein